MLHIFLYIIAFFLFLAVSAWKYAPYAFAMITIAGVNYTVRADFVNGSTKLTTATIIAAALLVVFIFSKRMQTKIALYTASALFVSYIMLSAAFFRIKEQIPVFKNYPDISFVILLAIMFFGSIAFCVSQGNEEGIDRDDNIVIAILFRIISTFFYGYALLVADWIRYDRFYMDKDDVLSFPLFKPSQIMALPELWILGVLLAIIAVVTIGIDIWKKRYSNF